MPRIARKSSQSCYYHVIVQGINKEYIFGKKLYIEKYKEIILKRLENSKVTILAYCIMNNHAHFLIYTEESKYLSKYMQRVNTTYSQFYNKINKRVGYVFRDRYFSQNILSEKQLYNCLKYIHNNPVKAGISTTMGEYKYSSYNEFFGRKEIIDNEGIKLLFGSIDKFKNEFYWLHNINNSYNTDEFYDIKEKEIYEFISEIERKYKKKAIDIKTDKELLKKILKEARKQTNVTIVELADIFDISKSTVGNYIKK